MRRLLSILPLLLFVSPPAQADLNISWQYAADPLVCDQSTSCDVQIIVTRETDSTEIWPVKEICNTGMRVEIPSDLVWTPLNRAVSICASGEVLTAQNPTSLPFTIGRVTDPAAAPVADYSVDLSFIPPNVAMVIEPAPLTLTVSVENVTTSDYVVYIPANETSGTTAADTQALQDATLVNSTFLNGRMDFNGSTARSTMGTYDFNSTGFTLSLWFEAGSTDICPNGDCRLFSKASGTSTADHWVMLSLIPNGVGDEKALRARLKISGTTQTVQGDTAAPIIDATLYHAVLTYDGTDIAMYLNGQPLTLTTSGNFPGTIDQDATVETWIGANPPGARFFDGTIDDVKIYDRALTAEEANALFGEGLVNAPPPITAPTAVNDTGQVVEANSVTINVDVNDSGTEPRTISNPANLAGCSGSLALVSNDVRFTHASGAGPCTFDYTTTNTAGTDLGSVTVTVIPAGGGGPDDLATLCADPGVFLCDGFEAGGEWTFLKAGGGPTLPEVKCDANAYEGSCYLEFLLEADVGPNLGGEIAYDIPATNAMYIYGKMWLDVGMDLYISSMDGAGVKHIQAVEGTRSCSGDSINVVDPSERFIYSVTNSCGGLQFRNDVTTAGQIGDFNIQPLEDTDGRSYPADGAEVCSTDGFDSTKVGCGCTFRHFTSANPIYQQGTAPNADHCRLYEEGKWVAIELFVGVGQGIKLWAEVNGVMTEIIEDLTADGGGGGVDDARTRIFYQTYKTSHTSGATGGPLKKRWDNIVFSTNCIASCGVPDL